MTSDADGNTLTDTSGRTNTWDSQNRLVSSTKGGVTSTFKYGADGLRRQSIVNGVTTDYVYDGQTLIREGFASGGTLSTVKATYLQGARGTECRIDETQQTEGYYDLTTHVLKGRGVTKWYVYDGLGSVVGETDFNGNLTSSPKYDVYGLVRANGGTASSRQGFVGSLGHITDTETGLIYMKARYYDPSLGRFESEDPQESGGNWFVYCDNNPITGSDPTGLATSGSGELDYDQAGAVAGFAALASVLVIIAGHNAIENCAADGIFLANQKKREKRSLAGQQNNWAKILVKAGLTQEEGRQLEDDGYTTRNGYSDDQIIAEGKRLARDLHGGDDDGDIVDDD